MTDLLRQKKEEVGFDTAEAKKRCLKYRRRILDISQHVTALHIAPAFSCVEIVDCVYNGLMKRDADDRFVDSFLLSKGHGCMTQYAILEDLGILKKEDVDRYCTKDGILGAHPDYGTPGISASTGSLGHGLSMSVGMAAAEKNFAVGSREPHRVFAVLSDGELQEGSTWEAVLMASSLKLDNLIAIIDNNNFQSLGKTSETHPSFYPLDKKFEAFGWETAEAGGHDSGALFNAITGRKGGRPFVLIASTTKGRGVSYMENVPIWHYRSPNPEEYQQAIKELEGVAP